MTGPGATPSVDRYTAAPVTAATCTDSAHRHATVTVRLRELRYAGLAMLVPASVSPLLPQGLGFPCALRALTGVPCPFCGLTRSVTATARLDLAAAFDLNPAGIAIVAAALALLLTWRVQRVRVPLWVIPTAVVALWAYQLACYPYGTS